MQLAAPLVWLADLRAIDDAALARCAGWLSAGEARRHAAFARPLRRRQFLAGRILLRQALGQLLGVAPQTVVLADQPGAAPLLESPRCAGAGLSISHSGPWVAVAASASVPLGLDIEVLDPLRDVDALAAQAFDAQQLAWWQARPASSRRRDFYALWCAQEARIKLARGEGECITLQHDELAIVLCSVASTKPPVLAQRTICVDDEIITLTIT